MGKTKTPAKWFVTRRNGPNCRIIYEGNNETAARKAFADTAKAIKQGSVELLDANLVVLKKSTATPKARVPKNLHPERYVGKVGCLRVKPNMQGEAPIWCPVKVIEATASYQRIFMLVEPLGGYGTMRTRDDRVWFSDPELNRCPEVPTR